MNAKKNLFFSLVVVTLNTVVAHDFPDYEAPKAVAQQAQRPAVQPPVQAAAPQVALQASKPIVQLSSQQAYQTVAPSQEPKSTAPQSAPQLIPQAADHGHREDAYNSSKKDPAIKTCQDLVAVATLKGCDCFEHAYAYASRPTRAACETTASGANVTFDAPITSAGVTFVGPDTFVVQAAGTYSLQYYVSAVSATKSPQFALTLNGTEISGSAYSGFNVGATINGFIQVRLPADAKICLKNQTAEGVFLTAPAGGITAALSFERIG